MQQILQKSQKTQKSPTLLHLWIWLITRFIVSLMMGCVGCFVFAIAIVVLYGLSGFITLKHVLQTDYQHMVFLAQLTQVNSLSFINHELNTIPNTINLSNLSLPMISAQYQHHLLLHLVPVISAVLLVVKLLMIRIYLLAHWCLLFLIVGLTALIDGLTQRYIRRIAAGRESALIYHNVKSLIMTSLIIGVFVDLVLPISFKLSEWILIISVVLFAVAIQVTAKSFKKYL